VFHVKQSQLDGLRSYESLVRRYSRSLNLVSPAGLAAFPLKIDEALRYAAPLETLLLERPRWLDVGSGAGLPAIPLAVAHPELPFILVERRKKRAGFLQLVKAQLGLENVTVVAEDVARWQDSAKFAMVSAQAVGSFSLLYRLTRHLHPATVTMLSRKGPDWQAEAEQLQQQLGLSGARLGALKIQEYPLANRGRLVAVTVPGGLPCPSSG
jgi:16S rRNA (guanine527-N7)-methyltransferase